MITVQGTYKKGTIRIKKHIPIKEGTEVTVLIPEIQNLDTAKYLDGLKKLQGIWAEDGDVKRAFNEIKKEWKKWKVKKF